MNVKRLLAGAILACGLLCGPCVYAQNPRAALYSGRVVIERLDRQSAYLQQQVRSGAIVAPQARHLRAEIEAIRRDEAARAAPRGGMLSRDDFERLNDRIEQLLIDMVVATGE